MFSGPMVSPAESVTNPITHNLVYALILLGLSGVMFLSRMDAPLMEPDEARYAEAPREMLQEQSYVTPLLHGQPFYHKPPLMYWLTMLGYQCFGISDWSARLVTGLIGVSTIMLIFWGTLAFLGRHVAFLSGMVLCLLPKYIYQARMVGMDGLLALCVVGGLIFAYRAICSPEIKKSDWLLSAVFCGLGIMTKGPLALVLMVPPTVVFRFLDPRFARISLLSWLQFGCVVVCLALPWYVAMFWQNRQLGWESLWFHNVQRFVEPFDHQEPFWYYLPGLLFGLLPWSLVLIPFVLSLLRKPSSNPSRSPAQGFFALALLWFVLFFSCSGCKRDIYLLPGLPLFAVVVGCQLRTFFAWETKRTFGLEWLLPTDRKKLAWLGFIGLIYVGLNFCWIPVVVGFWNVWQATWLTIIFSIVATIALVTARRRNPGILWGWNGVILILLCWCAVGLLLPNYNRRFSMRGSVARFRDTCADENLLIAAYPRRWDALDFYLDREVALYPPDKLADMMTMLQARKKTLVILKAGRHADRFLSELPTNLQFRPGAKQRQKTLVGYVYCDVQE